ncbi:helix-turn-helix domain-containing protein [Streptomyces sp. HPF1205]|uniref:helix-turn-helix domain-containing protein n=1 Tax=Streptomyces sp. HPF1205 TaxID=2873262 RepID=UPI001CEC4D05|nr:helix-turn-helix domain-containing protein [Streptomyces sp. HPF1205]
MVEGKGSRSPADAEVALGAGVRVAVLRYGVSAAFAAREAVSESVTWPLTLVSGAPLLVRHDQGGTRLHSGDLVLWNPARPVAVSKTAGASTRATVLRLPPRALPIPPGALGRLACRPVPSVSGPAALLARFLEGVADVAPTLEAAPTERLGSAAIDLAAVFLASLSAAHAPVARAARHDALLDDVTAYIALHLHDRGLSPSGIARAHHMSVRTLQYLFRRDDRTVTRYVLEQRLRRCRADLSDPAMCGVSAGRIGSRWGFSCDAVFSRAFRQAYGLPPGEWRRRHLPLR